MKDEVYRYFAAGWFALGVLACLVMLLVGSLVSDVLTDSTTPADEARCKSLQGEYGGGKCFKDGKEV